MPDAAQIHRQAEARLHAHAQRVIPPGSFVLPLDAVFALGGGNGELGEDIIREMFAGGRHDAAMPRILPPEVVRDIGHGNLANGRRVLQKFVADLRARQQPESGEVPQGDDTGGGKAGYFYERVPLLRHVSQPDSSHGTYVRGKAKASKSEADYTDNGSKSEHCSICRYYVNRNACEIVTGQIESDGWCKFFSRTK